jgi:hypothetical protein
MLIAPRVMTGMDTPDESPRAAVPQPPPTTIDPLRFTIDMSQMSDDEHHPPESG